MTDTQEEVKPCPFCGKAPHFTEWDDGRGVQYLYECTGCDTACTEFMSTPEDSMKVWNTRPIEEALRAEILTLIANNGQLIEDNRALRARVEELEGALAEIISALSVGSGAAGGSPYDWATVVNKVHAARKALNK